MLPCEHPGRGAFGASLRRRSAAGVQVPPGQPRVLRRVRHPLPRARHQPGVRGARSRVVVRPGLPRKAHLLGRALRHVRDDSGTQDAAPAHVRRGHRPRHRQQGGGAGQRPGPVRGRPHHRSFLRRGAEARHCRGGNRTSRGAGTGSARGGSGGDGGGLVPIRRGWNSRRAGPRWIRRGWRRSRRAGPRWIRGTTPGEVRPEPGAS